MLRKLPLAGIVAGAALGLCLACGTITAGPNGQLTKVSTFGSAHAMVDVGEDNEVRRAEIKSDGTNVFRIFRDAFQGVASVFGGGSPTVINVGGPPPEVNIEE